MSSFQAAWGKYWWLTLPSDQARLLVWRSHHTGFELSLSFLGRKESIQSAWMSGTGSSHSVVLLSKVLSFFLLQRLCFIASVFCLSLFSGRFFISLLDLCFLFNSFLFFCSFCHFLSTCLPLVVSSESVSSADVYPCRTKFWFCQTHVEGEKDFGRVDPSFSATHAHSCCHVV